MSALKDTRCAVLGAGGFLGTTLASACVETARCARSGAASPRRVAWHRMADGRPPTFNTSKKPFTGVTPFSPRQRHDAGQCQPDKIADLQSNVASTLGLLDACRDLGIKRIIFISSGGTIYGLPKQVPRRNPHPPCRLPRMAFQIVDRKIPALYEYLHGIEYRVLRVANPLVPTRRQSRVKPSPPSCNAADDAPLQIWGWLCRPGLYLRRRRHRCADPAVKHEGTSRVFNVGQAMAAACWTSSSHRVGIRTLACRGVPAQTRHGCSMQCSGHVARRAGARLAREDAFSGRHQADGRGSAIDTSSSTIPE